MTSDPLFPGEATGPAHWSLTLFVAGQSPKSLLAYANLKKVCQEHLADRYTIRVVDLMKEPALARENHILAVPTLLRESPPPAKKIIGSLSDLSRLIGDLEIPA